MIGNQAQWRIEVCGGEGCIQWHISLKGTQGRGLWNTKSLHGPPQGIKLCGEEELIVMHDEDCCNGVNGEHLTVGCVMKTKNHF